MLLAFQPSFSTDCLDAIKILKLYFYCNLETKPFCRSSLILLFILQNRLKFTKYLPLIAVAASLQLMKHSKADKSSKIECLQN
jgi:hypothetical protein